MNELLWNFFFDETTQPFQSLICLKINFTRKLRKIIINFHPKITSQNIVRKGHEQVSIFHEVTLSEGHPREQIGSFIKIRISGSASNPLTTDQK
jgi:hypothetical protein